MGLEQFLKEINVLLEPTIKGMAELSDKAKTDLSSLVDNNISNPERLDRIILYLNSNPELLSFVKEKIASKNNTENKITYQNAFDQIKTSFEGSIPSQIKDEFTKKVLNLLPSRESRYNANDLLSISNILKENKTLNFNYLKNKIGYEIQNFRLFEILQSIGNKITDIARMYDASFNAPSLFVMRKDCNEDDLVGLIDEAENLINKGNYSLKAVSKKISRDLGISFGSSDYKNLIKKLPKVRPNAVFDDFGLCIFDKEETNAFFHEYNNYNHFPLDEKAKLYGITKEEMVNILSKGTVCDLVKIVRNEKDVIYFVKNIQSDTFIEKEVQILKGKSTKQDSEPANSQDLKTACPFYNEIETILKKLNTSTNASYEKAKKVKPDEIVKYEKGVMNVQMSYLLEKTGKDKLEIRRTAKDLGIKTTGSNRWTRYFVTDELVEKIKNYKKESSKDKEDSVQEGEFRKVPMRYLHDQTEKSPIEIRDVAKKLKIKKEGAGSATRYLITDDLVEKIRTYSYNKEETSDSDSVQMSYLLEKTGKDKLEIRRITKDLGIKTTGSNRWTRYYVTDELVDKIKNYNKEFSDVKDKKNKKEQAQDDGFSKVSMGYLKKKTKLSPFLIHSAVDSLKIKTIGERAGTRYFVNDELIDKIKNYKKESSDVKERNVKKEIVQENEVSEVPMSYLYEKTGRSPFVIRAAVKNLKIEKGGFGPATRYFVNDELIKKIKDYDAKSGMTASEKKSVLMKSKELANQLNISENYLLEIINNYTDVAVSGKNVKKIEMRDGIMDRITNSILTRSKALSTVQLYNNLKADGHPDLSFKDFFKTIKNIPGRFLFNKPEGNVEAQYITQEGVKKVYELIK